MGSNVWLLLDVSPLLLAPADIPELFPKPFGFPFGFSRMELEKVCLAENNLFSLHLLSSLKLWDLWYLSSTNAILFSEPCKMGFLFSKVILSRSFHTWMYQGNICHCENLALSQFFATLQNLLMSGLKKHKMLKKKAVNHWKAFWPNLLTLCNVKAPCLLLRAPCPKLALP